MKSAKTTEKKAAELREELASAPAAKAPAKKVPAKKAPAKKTPAKKTPAKKTPAKKTTPAKKAPVKKASAKKTPAKKTPAKKTPAKKTPAKKAPAKKTHAKKTHAKKTAAKKTAHARPQVPPSDVVAFSPSDDDGFVSFVEEALENPAMPKAISARDILDFVPTDEILLNLSAEERRDRIVAALEAVEDLGIGDSPRGRKDAYGDFLAGTDSSAVRAGFLTAGSNSSSCAITIRALWRFLGAQHADFLDKFVNSKPFEFVVRFAKACEAYSPVKPGAEGFNPDKGDVLILEKVLPNNKVLQHIFTIVGIDGDTITSIDGGEPSPTGSSDGGCNGIHRMVRTFDRKTACFKEDANHRPVTGWIDASMLKFTVPRIDLVRGGR